MSFVIDTVGQTNNTTSTLKLPSTVQITDSDNEDINEVEPPSFVKKILANIEKLQSSDDFKAPPNVKRVPRTKNGVDLEEEYKNIGWTGKKKKGVAEIHTVVDPLLKDSRKANEVLKKSVLTPGYERLHTVSAYDVSDKQLKGERKREREKTKGKKWYGLPATELTEEVKHDLEVLQMRSVLDPKHFYKKNDLKVLPKYFQVGKVMDAPLDYYNNRCTKKERKRTLVDELLADAEFNKYNKKRYAQIIEERQKTHYKAFKQARKLKRKNKK